jgi:hypothetical protein
LLVAAKPVLGTEPGNQLQTRGVCESVDSVNEVAGDRRWMREHANTPAPEPSLHRRFVQ